jgi:hypothetical protein
MGLAPRAPSAWVRRLYGKPDQVSDVRVSRRDFGRVQLHRNNRGYHFALRICLLIHKNLMIVERVGRARFRDFRADAQPMGAVFESFVFNFFRVEQRRFRVSRPHIAWHAAEGSDADLLRLPQMRTDVVTWIRDVDTRDLRSRPIVERPRSLGGPHAPSGGAGSPRSPSVLSCTQRRRNGSSKP